ncbi:protein of unknown function [Vibrio tapetis subsp. tapetis]|uniref:Uncharacterized protein n=1 Tax=Vibrio tapetis subsp. tapetis TaxID=1671868 RepID=A0A2N8ZG05_9VIBR|nr:protein of unknown function [Vibrio tapetis subsp. tapetis]
MCAYHQLTVCNRGYWSNSRQLIAPCHCNDLQALYTRRQTSELEDDAYGIQHLSLM